MDAGSVVDDSDARAFWLHSFGAQTYQTPFERFAVALAAVAIEDDDKRCMFEVLFFTNLFYFTLFLFFSLLFRS